MFNQNNTKLIVDVTEEPLTLSEIKNHLRLNSGSFEDDITTYQVLTPSNYGIGVNTGTSIDVLSKIAIININSGTNGVNGTIDVVLQESDDDVTYTDWHIFTQITESNDNQIFEKQYTGSKQYIRCIATVANASCYFSIDCIVNSYMTDEDDLLSVYLQASRLFGEDYTKTAFSPQTWEMYLNAFPTIDYINWFKPPLTSFTSLSVKDYNGDITTLTENTHYIVDVDTKPGKIFLPYSEQWYDFIEFPYNAVILRGVCGFTNVAPYIFPKTFKQALLLHISYMYKYRDTDIPKTHLETIYNMYNLQRFEWF